MDRPGDPVTYFPPRHIRADLVNFSSIVAADNGIARRDIGEVHMIRLQQLV